MTGGPALASKIAPDSAGTPAPRGRAVPDSEAGRPLLDVRGVTMRYKTQAHLITATYRVSFSVLQGDRFVVVGPSGCGKSTLLKAVGGYLMPTEGEITLKGERITRPGPDRMMVFQEFDQLLPWKTVLENVTFPLKTTGLLTSRAATDRAMQYLEKVKLADFAHNYPHTLSGGMKQRVAIARGHGDGAGYSVDGRAVRRARRAHALAHAGRIAGTVGRNPLHGAVCYPLHPRSDQARQPHPAAVAPSRAR